MQRTLCCSCFILWATAITPSPVYAQQTAYTVSPDSTFMRGCFPPALCPMFWSDGVEGTFTLGFTWSDGSIDYYDVDDVLLTVAVGDRVIRMWGSGTYQIGEGDSGQQELQLDLMIDDEEHQFDSGLVPVQTLFPLLDVEISIHGKTGFDTVIAIRAAPSGF